MNLGSILNIIETVAGPLENLIGLAIHNPKSQAVENIIVTDFNTALGVLSAIAGAKGTSTTAPTA